MFHILHVNYISMKLSKKTAAQLSDFEKNRKEILDKGFSEVCKLSQVCQESILPLSSQASAEFNEPSPSYSPEMVTTALLDLFLVRE